MTFDPLLASLCVLQSLTGQIAVDIWSKSNDENVFRKQTLLLLSGVTQADAEQRCLGSSKSSRTSANLLLESAS